MRLGLLLFLFVATQLDRASGQTLTGSWYGRADVMMRGVASNYLTEFILKQKGNEVEGLFGYYFKNSYQSFFVRGAYDKKSREVVIKDLPLIFYASSTDGIECPMQFRGTLMVSKVSSTLKGIFHPASKYRYTCPQLRVNMVMDPNEKNQDSAMRLATARTKFWQPRPEDYVITTATGVGSSAEAVPSDSNQPDKITKETTEALVSAFAQRTNIYEKELEVIDDSIRVSFYDNGDIDDDTISVFMNEKPVLVKRGLTSRALNIYVGLDSTKAVNELSMFADNLGKFPPNTALMVIYDGRNRYELYLSASMKHNATIRLRKVKGQKL
ncbi:MAG TPA: hypothetical protein VK618_08335 [Flavitalea sp.]|nr:hypothetical protein [Flavitalea sp.]